MMMKMKMIRKLKSNAGESLAETLVALLIAAFAIIMLAGALSASSGIVIKSRKRLNEYYSENEAAGGVVKMGGLGKSGNIDIKYNDTSLITQNINFYVNDKFNDRPVVSYKNTE